MTVGYTKFLLQYCRDAMTKAGRVMHHARHEFLSCSDPEKLSPQSIKTLDIWLHIIEREIDSAEQAARQLRHAIEQEKDGIDCGH